MNQEALVPLARLSAMCRKAGVPFDLNQFANDDRYAGRVLEEAFQSSNVDVVAAALSLANKLGRLNGVAKNEHVPTRADPPRDRPSREEIAKVVNPTPEQRWVKSIR